MGGVDITLSSSRLALSAGGGNGVAHKFGFRFLPLFPASRHFFSSGFFPGLVPSDAVISICIRFGSAAPDFPFPDANHKPIPYRCRKKMKRVERRGTLENQAQLANLAIQQQQQHQPLPRTTSHPQLPLSQSSDRSIHRTDTVLAHHATMPSSSSSLRDNLRHSSRTATASSSAIKQPHRQQQHQPTPPAIAALRDDVEEEEETEGDQLPTSNVGRGAGRSNGLKSSKNVDPDAEAEAEAEILGAVDAAVAGGSADGDGDAEGEEADAEAELLEAVDAAEANSTSSGGERERGWLKAEPN